MPSCSEMFLATIHLRGPVEQHHQQRDQKMKPAHDVRFVHSECDSDRILLRRDSADTLSFRVPAAGTRNLHLCLQATADSSLRSE